jgi:hypothetical protein
MIEAMPAPGSYDRRSPMRRTSILATLVALALTGVATWGTHSVVSDQENRLLKERAAEVNLVLTASINAIPASLQELGGILKATDNSVTAFEQAAKEAAGPSQAPVTFAWLKPASGGGYQVLAAEGGGLSSGDVVTDQRVATFDATMKTQQLVATPVIGPQRLLGFAIGAPAAPAGTVLYRQSPLGPVRAPRAASSAPFSELEAVIYASQKQDVNEVLASTSSHLPLRGDVRSLPLPAGATKWLTVVKAKRPLVGSVAANAHWLALGVGLLGSLLVGLIVEISARRRDAALALYATEHHVAETLQRSLLPQLPSLPGLELAARYLPSGTGQQVGGDWFDVFPVDGGRVGIAVGDVIGHDTAAASAMAQIRAALRAFALWGDPPSVVVNRLDRFVDAFRLTQLVTVLYGLLEPPAADGSRLLRYTNAGHLAPLLRSKDGAVETLVGGGSVVIGAPIPADHGQAEQVIESGSTLVLFTDGLVEAPGRSLDEALGKLSAAVATAARTDAEALCEQVVGTMPEGTRRDDVAVLAVRLADPASTDARAAETSVASG